MNKIQYDIFKAESSEELVEIVNQKLAEGWDLHGSPSGVFAINGEIRVGQAMTRRVQPNENQQVLEFTRQYSDIAAADHDPS